MDCCRFHNQPTKFICTTPHICQRKLCMECIYQHESQYIPFENFFYYLQESIQLITLNNTTINQLRLNFKSLRSKTEYLIKDVIEFLKTIQYAYEKIEKEEQIQFQLLQQLRNLSECSFYLLNQLGEILQAINFENLNVRKTNKLSIQQSSINESEGNIKQCNNEIKHRFTQIFSEQHMGEMTQKNKVESYRALVGSMRSQNNKAANYIADLELQNLMNVGRCYTQLMEKNKDFGKKQSETSHGQKYFMKQFSKLQVYEVGEYMNDRRQGVWKLISQNKEIGGGRYNFQGQKEGIWIEIVGQFLNQNQFSCVGECRYGKKIDDQEFQERGAIKEEQAKKTNSNQDVVQCQAIYLLLKGKYENNKRVGKWNQEWRDYKNNNFLKMQHFSIQKYERQGGFFDYKNGIQKIGIWTEISEDFNFNNQVTLTGMFYNGKKVGRWNIKLQDNEKNKITKFQGGHYDKNGLKNGKWTGIRDYQSFNQVTLNGEYFKGSRAGMWVLQFKKKYIGVGCYQLGTNENKFLKGRFQEFSYVSFCKISNLGGSYVDLKDSYNWDRYQNQERFPEEYKQIDGGLQDKEGKCKKIGKWVELFEGFKDYAQVTYDGQYNMNGMKVDRWNIMYCEDEEFKLIGGGTYDQQGNQNKIGKWIELDEKFYYEKQVTYIGEYNWNGMKVGRWDILYCSRYDKEYKQIGGGSYDLEGNQKKIGKWVELFEQFQWRACVTYNGEYDMNNMKVGRWNIMYCIECEQENKQIGGGSYDLEGNQNKIGKWIELDKGFQEWNQVTYNGEYNMNGQKVGIWVELDIKKNEKRGENRYDD